MTFYQLVYEIGITDNNVDDFKETLEQDPNISSDFIIESIINKSFGDTYDESARFQMLKLVFDRGIRSNAPQHLLDAVMDGRRDMIRLLLNHQTYEAETLSKALCHAVLRNDQILELLLTFGADTYEAEFVAMDYNLYDLIDFMRLDNLPLIKSAIGF